MRILAHVHGYPPTHNAGAEWMLHWMLEAMVRRGHTARVVAGVGTLGSWSGTLDGVEVVEETQPNIEAAYGDAEVVLTHLDRTRVVIGLAHKAAVPLVHIIHNAGTIPHWQMQPREAALIIFNSLWLAMQCRWRGPQIVIPPPVSVERYRVDNSGADAITLLNLSVDKGGPQFFELARMMPDRHFLAVRGGYAAQHLPQQMPPNVRLVENQADVREVLRQTRILLMPSKHETWGRAAAEAACSGIPSICHPSDGLLEAMGGAAIWERRENLNGWAAAIRRLDNPQHYMAASAAALERAHQLDPEPAMDELDRVLRQIVGVGPKVDVSAFYPHYLDHIEPVWRRLPPRHRGNVICSHKTLRHALSRGMVAWPCYSPTEHQQALQHGRGPVLVSSSYDMGLAQKVGRPQFLMEHGAGQTYTGARSTSYAGGPGRAGVALFLNPGAGVTQHNERSYPEKLNAEIGCPKLDPWLSGLRPRRPPNKTPTVCLSFHWPANVAPEAGTAFQHFRDGLSRNPAVRDLLRSRYRLVCHAHPRSMQDLRPWFQGYGIEVWDSFEQVLDEADVYCCDNSSTLFEFAAIGKPVVMLTDPRWRRDVEHGMRFWQYADLGVECGRAEDLLACIQEALTDSQVRRHRRDEISDAVYRYRDGYSADRAVWAILTYGLQAAYQLMMEVTGLIEMKALKNFMGQPGEGNGQHGMVMKQSTFFVPTESRAQALEKKMLAKRKRHGETSTANIPIEQLVGQIPPRVAFPSIPRAPITLTAPELGAGPLGPSETKENPPPRPPQKPTDPAQPTEAPSKTGPGPKGLKQPGSAGPAFRCESEGCDLVFTHPKWLHEHQVEAEHIVPTSAQPQQV